MSHRHNISLTDDLVTRLKAHPDFEAYKTIPALIRHFIELGLATDSIKALKRMQQDLTTHEIAWCQEQYDKEKYHYDVQKQFSKDAEPPRSLCEITMGLYQSMRGSTTALFSHFLTKEELDNLK